MKKKFLKALVIVGCAILLVLATITGTVAYLTSVKEVKNTFTVGNVTITLDETDVDLYGVKETEARVTKNEYKLIPGHEYVKDPTIHVAAGSEDCYIFFKVENGLGAAATLDIDSTKWESIDTNVYCYKEIATAGNDYKAFTKFTLANNADLSAYTDTDNDGVVDATIVVTAYAVQKDGIDTVQAAWEAVKNIAPTNP